MVAQGRQVSTRAEQSVPQTGNFNSRPVLLGQRRKEESARTPRLVRGVTSLRPAPAPKLAHGNFDRRNSSSLQDRAHPGRWATGAGGHSARPEQSQGIGCVAKRILARRLFNRPVQCREALGLREHLIDPIRHCPLIPFSATTYTFAAGPQFNLRNFKWVTLFARPGLGALHESASLQIPATLAPLASLVPGLSPNLTNTVVFYGGGGGFDYNLSKHVAIRVSADFIRTHLFSDLLEPCNGVRVSVGPVWRWGEVK